VYHFIKRLRDTNFLPLFLSQEDIEFRGLKQGIIDFLRKIEQKFYEDPNLRDEIGLHLEEMHD